jgi:hypothetical protein
MHLSYCLPDETEAGISAFLTNNHMETLLSLCVGLGLSAACGFRVFVPLLVMSVASYSGHLTLAPTFAWIGSPAALIAFSLATALEVAGYYIPWVDNFLDTVATPAAVVAGTVVTASMITDVSPFLKWSLAIVAGGGAAGAVQTSTVLIRSLSTGATGGLMNPIFATAELGGSIITALMAVIAPLFAFLLIAILLIAVARRFIRYRTSRAT